jgi:ATP-dependent protease HslVU (ClpYQ) ATPase subunit
MDVHLLRAAHSSTAPSPESMWLPTCLSLQALLATEGVTLKVTDGAVRAIARVAEEVNRLLDNIGARRLHTVMERILSEVSYSAPDIVEAARK